MSRGDRRNFRPEDVQAALATGAARDAFEAGLDQYLGTPAGAQLGKVAVWYLAGSDPKSLLVLLEVFGAEMVGGVVPAALLEDLRSTLVEDVRRGFAP